MDKNMIINHLTDNWEKVVNEIPQHWKNFKRAHLELIKDYVSLEDQLKSVYEFSQPEIHSEILAFMEKLGLLPIEIYLEQLKKALYQSTYAASIKVSQALERSVDRLKGSSGEFQQTLIRYVKDNPIKAIGYSILCGVLFQKIIKKL